MLASVQQNDKNWIDIQSKRNWEEIMKGVYEIPSGKDNEGFQCHLMIDLLGKKKH